MQVGSVVYPLSTNNLPFCGSEMCAPQRPSGTVDRRRFPGQQIGPVAFEWVFKALDIDGGS
jgi:hypothetical protein